jgi:hypothetical protein
MTTTTTLTAPPTRPATAQSGKAGHLWRTGAMAGLAASVATSAFAALAHAVGVPLKISGDAIPPVGFAQLTFVAVIVGTILAVGLAHRAARPRHTFVSTTVVLTLLSIVPDALVDASVATKLTLALTHVVAAAIVFPALASRLTD